MSQVGKKLYVTLDSQGTYTWLTRQEARQNKTTGGILIEVPLTQYQQAKVQEISESF